MGERERDGFERQTPTEDVVVVVDMIWFVGDHGQLTTQYTIN